MKKIDTCGMSCPQPVLMVKKAMENEKGTFEVLVDNNTAKGNIERFLEGKNVKIEVSEVGEYILMKVLRS